MKDKQKRKLSTILGISALVGGAALLVSYGKKISKKAYKFFQTKVVPLKSSARSLVNKVKTSRKRKAEHSHHGAEKRKRFSFRKQGTTHRRKKTAAHDTKHK